MGLVLPRPTDSWPICDSTLSPLFNTCLGCGFALPCAGIALSSVLLLCCVGVPVLMSPMPSGIFSCIYLQYDALHLIVHPCGPASGVFGRWGRASCAPPICRPGTAFSIQGQQPCQPEGTLPDRRTAPSYEKGACDGHRPANGTQVPPPGHIAGRSEAHAPR